MIQRVFILTIVLLSFIGCSNNNSESNDPAAALYGTWVTDLDPLGHEGHSHSTFNPGGTYELDMAFIVAGSDCHLDVTTVGTFVADGTTISTTHESGTRVVSQCSNDEYNHEERPLTEEELDAYDIGQMSWSVTGDMLTLTDEGDLTRTYTRDPAAALYSTWVTDLSSLGHEGHSHSTFNPGGTYELDMAFIVAGSDCHLDVTTVGTFVADGTTISTTHESGTRVISQCSNDEYNHEERPLTEEELDAYDIGQMSWSVTGDMLTLTDEGDLTRTYTRDPAAALYGTWVTDLDPLGHEGHSHSTFNPGGTYELDMAFIVAGSDCHLDVTTVGTFVADATTISTTHESGTRVISQCSNDEYNHEERPLTEEELDAYDIGQMSWSVTSGVLTLTDGNLTRTYIK